MRAGGRLCRLAGGLGRGESPREMLVGGRIPFVAVDAVQDAAERAGAADVIYQPYLSDGTWRGFADFLERLPDGTYEGVAVLEDAGHGFNNDGRPDSDLADAELARQLGCGLHMTATQLAAAGSRSCLGGLLKCRLLALGGGWQQVVVARQAGAGKILHVDAGFGDETGTENDAIGRQLTTIAHQHRVLA